MSSSHFQTNPDDPFPELIPCNLTGAYPPVTLLRITPIQRGPVGSFKVRNTLLRMLNRMAEHPVSLEETPMGPRLITPVRETIPHLSLSYAARDAWVALRMDGPVGVDAVSLADLPPWEERQALAELYFEARTTAHLKQNDWDALCFAREWAAYEARCKLASIALAEEAPPPPALIREIQWEDTVVVIALPRPQRCMRRLKCDDSP